MEIIRLVSLGQTMGKAAGLANIQFVFARRRIVPMGLLYSSENSVSVVNTTLISWIEGTEAEQFKAGVKPLERLGNSRCWQLSLLLSQTR